ncbi:MAG: hypothetical protein IJU76_04905 [Desulfovibrionaceae bacterium]|nr:hypothetical protein [Desulfovibrionaceae bacterium]
MLCKRERQCSRRFYVPALKPVCPDGKDKRVRHATRCGNLKELDVG